jgi:hypothetical protein
MDSLSNQEDLEGVGIISVGGDMIFNKLPTSGLPMLGFMITVGIGVPTSIPEGHVRFGNTFVLSVKEQLARQIQ